MKYVKKDEVIEILNKYIEARKDKNCSKQAIVERVAFEYALAIINKAKEYDFETD